MTGCRGRTDDAQRYVEGEMPEPEQSAFEEHFFACDACFEAVRGFQEIQRALTEAAPETAPRAGLALGRNPFVWMAVAATVVLVAVGVAQLRRHPVSRPERVTANLPGTTGAPSQPSSPAAAPPARTEKPAAAPSPDERIPQLAVVVAPRYFPLPTRGDEDEDARAFAAAMSQYSAGRYRAAAQELRALTRRSPDMVNAQFFLGVSELLTGNPAAARAALRQCAASDVQPYSDESHFYLAKAALRAKDVRTAERELKLASDRGAGPRGEAARLLAELKSIPR